MLTNKTIVLGVTGSIAAYKAAELASRLTQEGASVDVVMTRAAQEFITPLTFRALTHRPVVTEMFDLTAESSVEHVALAERADLVIIAPATANIIARLAAGIADDMLSCTVLATKAPVILAPAMNVHMYENQITQDNLAKLQARGFVIVGPGYGILACGDIGPGRLADMELLLGTIKAVLGRTGDLAGKRLVVTAGGTQEPLDPVRHISNRSSGKMGYAIAEAARDRGATTVLISAPTALFPPVGVELIEVQTASQMQEAVIRAATQAHALIMAAAVADFRPAKIAEHKIKKETAATLVMELMRNPDIISQVGDSLVKVGFAAESENLIENAQTKLREKRLDLIAANDVTAPDSGFGADTNKVVLVEKGDRVESLPLLPKLEVAHRILDKVVQLIALRESQHANTRLPRKTR